MVSMTSNIFHICFQNCWMYKHLSRLIPTQAPKDQITHTQCATSNSIIRRTNILQFEIVIILHLKNIIKLFSLIFLPISTQLFRCLSRSWSQSIKLDHIEYVLFMQLFKLVKIFGICRWTLWTFWQYFYCSFPQCR